MALPRIAAGANAAGGEYDRPGSHPSELGVEGPDLGENADLRLGAHAPAADVEMIDALVALHRASLVSDRPEDAPLGE